MSNIKLVESKEVRSARNKEEQKWYFSIIDVIEILTGTDRGRKYWKNLKTKLKKEGSGLSEKIGQLKMETGDGKYVLDEKKKQQLERYEPTVSISTKRISNRVEIRVSDNGNGIPQKVLNKIFQPFFTTKPTGQGTELGLSLSYYIVTKGHGGELKVETKEGEGSSFIVTLPNLLK